eukprot:TRINITY_DN2289_c0_g1_i1.p1 TRINITY_DN2289_c0_g1~~TRINITY_DN2289_c0_g1_i1.p1  ORF type:complete len:601 (+),score=105.45 TRINITY_DN2289_c0_g1_i1:30-1805(+)
MSFEIASAHFRGTRYQECLKELQNIPNSENIYSVQHNILLCKRFLGFINDLELELSLNNLKNVQDNNVHVSGIYTRYNLAVMHYYNRNYSHALQILVPFIHTVDALPIFLAIQIVMLFLEVLTICSYPTRSPIATFAKLIEKLPPNYRKDFIIFLHQYEVRFECLCGDKERAGTLANKLSDNLMSKLLKANAYSMNSNFSQAGNILLDNKHIPVPSGVHLPSEYILQPSEYLFLYNMGVVNAIAGKLHLAMTQIIKAIDIAQKSENHVNPRKNRRCPYLNIMKRTLGMILLSLPDDQTTPNTYYNAAVALTMNERDPHLNGRLAMLRGEAYIRCALLMQYQTDSNIEFGPTCDVERVVDVHSGRCFILSDKHIYYTHESSKKCTRKSVCPISMTDALRKAKTSLTTAISIFRLLLKASRRKQTAIMHQRTRAELLIAYILMALDNPATALHHLPRIENASIPPLIAYHVVMLGCEAQLRLRKYDEAVNIFNSVNINNFEGTEKHSILVNQICTHIISNKNVGKINELMNVLRKELPQSWILKSLDVYLSLRAGQYGYAHSLLKFNGSYQYVSKYSYEESSIPKFEPEPTRK